MSAARSYYRKTTVIDPLAAGMNPGWVEWLSGDFEKALHGYRTEYEMDPESPYGRWAYGTTLAWAGHAEEAHDVLSEIVRDTPETVFGRFSSFLLHALRGNAQEALQAVSPELVTSARLDAILAYEMAGCYAMLDRVEEAVNWMEHAVQRGFINYPLFSKRDPFLAKLSGNPRYEALLQKAKERWEAFEV